MTRLMSHQVEEDMMARLVYTRRGEGEPLLLVHGIGHRKEAWAPVVDLLATHHDVVALDLPGFGSSPTAAVHGMQGLVDVVAEFADDLGLDHPHVAGNSLGGAVALELASRGTVASATALSPAGFWTRASQTWAFAVLLEIRASALAPMSVIERIADHRGSRAAAMAWLYAHPGRISREAFLGDTLALCHATAFGTMIRAGSRYRYRGTPQVPTTVAWGTRDRILLPSQAERALQQIPQARHVPLPDCGHVPMLDDPQLVADVILTQTSTSPWTPSLASRTA